MFDKIAAKGFADACATFKVAALPRFSPAAPVGGPGFLSGTMEHGKNLFSGLKGMFGGAGGASQRPQTVRGRSQSQGPNLNSAGGGGIRAQAAANQGLARQQVMSSLKGLAPAAGMAGLGYLAARDSPEEKQMAAMKQQGMY